MTRQRALTPAEEQDVFQLYCQRVPQAAIARRYDVSEPTIYDAVKRSLTAIAPQQREELEHSKQESLAAFRTVVSEAWQSYRAARPGTHAAAAHLNTIIEAEKFMARLNGLEHHVVDHRVLALHRIQEMMAAPIPAYLLEGAGDAQPQ